MITLAIFARDEAERIGRCIRSCRGVDRVALALDSRTTDGTAEAAAAEATSIGAAFSVCQFSWRGFGDAQNVALHHAERATGPGGWVLMLDADEYLEPHPYGHAVFDRLRKRVYPTTRALNACRVWSGMWRTPLHEPFRDEWEVWSPKLFRVGSGWRFEGERHASAVGPGELGWWADADILNGNDGRQGTMSAEDKRARFRADAERFAPAAAAGDLRAAYYYAQSLKDSGDREAAAWAYQRRAAMGTPDDEYTFMAALEAARLTSSVALYMLASSLRPWRPEPRLDLAEQYASILDFDTARMALDVDSYAGRRDDRWLVQRSAQGALGFGPTGPGWRWRNMVKRLYGD